MDEILLLHQNKNSLLSYKLSRLPTTAGYLTAPNKLGFVSEKPSIAGAVL
jgi:hypothetical protein